MTDLDTWTNVVFVLFQVVSSNFPEARSVRFFYKRRENKRFGEGTVSVKSSKDFELEISKPVHGQ